MRLSPVVLLALTGQLFAAVTWAQPGSQPAAGSAVESTQRLHQDIFRALQQRDAELAAATDIVHLAAGERWLQSVSEDGAG